MTARFEPLLASTAVIAIAIAIAADPRPPRPPRLSISAPSPLDPSERERPVESPARGPFGSIVSLVLHLLRCWR